ncbi:MAG: DUF4175 family protein [Alphaproteobacteria bacterium]
MASRTNRARNVKEAGSPGSLQLTFAAYIVVAENILKAFARPLMLAGAFIALSWFGILNSFYPWPHLAALILFTLLFFEALGRAKQSWQPATQSQARRRVEEASHLQHRPLDVLEDRPAFANTEHMALWQVHMQRAREQTKHLRWPRWKLSFAEKDPYALRFALLIVLVIAAISGWGALGGRMIAAINPALGKLQFMTPTMNAWITPPDYTHLPPIMIATPAGARHGTSTIEVPEGSTISAHMAERDGDVPVLIVNGEEAEFAHDDHGDYGVTQELHGGDSISIRRGWQQLGSWKIRVVTDKAPQIALVETPTVTERKSMKLSYEANDDYGVASISVRITPRESLPGAHNDPIEIPLSSPNSKEIKRTSYEDMTSHPWAGLPVQVQLIATDEAGHRAETQPSDFTLPERLFFHPIARTLVEERRKLLVTPDDTGLRNEVANVMAGISAQPNNYRGDPVVLMALRSGAVRLVLDHDNQAAKPVNDLLWQTAVRVEDGSVGLAEQNLRQAQKELADALDRNASDQEIQQKIDRLHQALAQYLSQLANRMAARPGPVEDFSEFFSNQKNVMTPQDIERMLDKMRTMSSAGARDQARQELARLQSMLENMQTERPQFSAEQKEAMRQLMALKELTKQQQQLLDKTFQNAQTGNKTESRKLSTEQNELLNKLQGLIGNKKGQDAPGLDQGASAMKRAGSQLQQGAAQGAIPHQNDAMKALQQAMQSLVDDLRTSMMMMPMPGTGAFGQNADPFGRNNAGGRVDDGGVQVPEHMETRRVREILNELQRRAGDVNRPRPEREYIDRLLQNF